MRIFEQREHMFLFHAGDEYPPQMMLEWGNSKRRRRFQPRGVTITWSRRDGEEWELHSVFLSLDFVHAQMNAGTGMTIYQGRAGWKIPAEQWMTDLIEQSRPRELVTA